MCESHGTKGANRFNLPSLYKSVNVLSADDGNSNGFSHICTEHAPLLTDQIRSILNLTVFKHLIHYYPGYMSHVLICKLCKL